MRRTNSVLALAVGMVAGTVAGNAQARPVAPPLFCESYPTAPTCLGQTPACGLCHKSTGSPPTLNGYGQDVGETLSVYVSGPLDDQAFSTHLSTVLAEIETLDSDGDALDNLSEIQAGSFPGDTLSTPAEAVCPTSEALATADLGYEICSYDSVYAYRKVGIDFCGLPPAYEDIEHFRALSPADQYAALHALVDECLDSEFWRGANGQLWQIAHNKIRPLLSFLAPDHNFFDDYAFFTWAQIDDNDVRDVLVGQYVVLITVDEEEDDIGGVTRTTNYLPLDDLESQAMQPERRAGLLTHSWMLFYNTMFTALPRTTAAQAYRSYLGMDIAASEGLNWPVAGEPVDYDNAGVSAPECAVCHSTLDPLAYPFATYNGIQADGEIGKFMYDEDRIAKYFANDYPDMLSMPESGYIFGQPVQNLLEWAQVAANSDAFFIASTKDYWQLLLGRPPRSDNAAELDELEFLWKGLRDHHSVELMLHQLVDTEAYGAP